MTLMGEARASRFDELQSYPVVEPGGALNRNALDAARRLRGRSNDSTGIERVTRQLLNDKFDADIDKPDRSMPDTQPHVSGAFGSDRAVVDANMRMSSDGERTTIQFMTEDVARDGLVLDADGLDMSAYRDNPVVLWQHGQDPRRGAEPIAKTVELQRNDDGWLATIEWYDDDFSQRIKEKVKRGFLNAASIGWNTEDVARGEQPPRIAESDMTEFSIVSVPADAGALVEEREHYAEGGKSEFKTICEGLMCLEAVRRMGEGMTMAQARNDVISEINERVPGGMGALKSMGCPFEDAMDPTAGFEALGSVLQADPQRLQMAAGVDGCMYDDTPTSNTDDRAEATATSPPDASDSGATGTESAVDDRDAAQDGATYVRLSTLKKLMDEQSDQPTREDIRTVIKQALGKA